MKLILEKLFNISFFSILVLLSVNLFSCSDSAPQIASCSSSVVFTWSNETDKPEMSFSAFVETSSDVHRVENFSVESRANNFKWLIDNPLIFSNTRTSWACGLNLSASSLHKIPSGVYDVEYTDAENRNVHSIMNVNFPEELSEKKLSEAEDFLSPVAKCQIALYDTQDVLMYFGLRKDAWKTDELIFAMNQDCAKFRVVYSAPDESYVCYFPFVTKENLKESSSQTESEN